MALGGEFVHEFGRWWRVIGDRRLPVGLDECVPWCELVYAGVCVQCGRSYADPDGAGGG